MRGRVAQRVRIFRNIRSDSTPFMKILPPNRAKMEISEAPKASPTSGLTRSCGESPVPRRQISPNEIKTATPKSPPPATSIPVMAPALNATSSALCMPFDAACAVRTFIYPDRHVHADKTTRAGQNGTDQETRLQSKIPDPAKNDNDKQNKPDNTDCPILPGEIRRSSLLNGMGNFLYAFITRIPVKNPATRNKTIYNGQALHMR